MKFRPRINSGQMRIPRLLRIGLPLLLTCVFPAHAQSDALQDGDRVLARLGGDKSQPNQFIARCPPGQQVAGFDLGVGDRKEAGDGVFSIQPLCFTARAPSVAGALESHRSRLGGAGKRDLRLTCPSDRPVVTMMKIEGEKEIGVGWGDFDAVSVNGIGLYCGLVDRQIGPPVAGPSYWGRLRYQDAGGWGAGLQALADEKNGERTGTIWGNSSCADGLVSVGISGQFRERLYALGLICGEPRLTQGVSVKPAGRVKLPGGQASGPPRPICDVAREARARNSPAAPGLEARCNADAQNNQADSYATEAAIRRGDTVSLNPQPLPPDPDSVRDNPGDTVGLNPQPLPPRVGSTSESAAQKKASQAGIIIVSGKNDGPFAHKAPGIGPLLQIRSGEAIDFDALAARGPAIAAADPLAMELRNQQPGADALRGFDIGMAAAEGQTVPGPGKQRIHDSLPLAQRAGYAAAVDFSLARNRMKITDLAPRGAQIASEDPLAMELRNHQPEGPARLGFDIGMAAAEGQTAPGPGKDRIRDSLLDAEKGGFLFAVAYSLDRNRNAERAATGAAVAAADPAVAAARRAQPDVLHKLGFDIATAIFGDPALGAQGNTAVGPGSRGIRNALLSPSALQGYDDAVAFHLRRTYPR